MRDHNRAKQLMVHSFYIQFKLGGYGKLKTIKKNEITLEVGRWIRFSLRKKMEHGPKIVPYLC